MVKANYMPKNGEIIILAHERGMISIVIATKANYMPKNGEI
jgi:hypothetical protein